MYVYLVFKGVVLLLPSPNVVTHPINFHNSILVCIFVITTRRIVFSSFHIFHFYPYLGRGFYFNLYLLYLKKLFMEKFIRLKDIIYD